MNSIITLKSTITPELEGKRLDQALCQLFPEYSRARLQHWIKADAVKVDGKILRAKDKVKAGNNIDINTSIEITDSWQEPQEIPLDIIYEDHDIIVLNKPVGLVIHPGAGQKDQTLLNALLYRYPELKKIPRAGIVHRLDKDTSGLLVIARTLEAHTKLVAALQKREIKREYVAIVNGVLTAGGSINEPIGRHKTMRTKMAVTPGGKHAITHYRVIAKSAAYTLVHVILETGRTHQIRVHFAHIKHPIVGDPTYGGRLKIPGNINEKLEEYIKNFNRQALHARKLTLTHPRTGELMTFEAKLPKDMEKLIKLLRKFA